MPPGALDRAVRAYSAPTDPIAVFSYFYGEGGGRWREKGKGREGKERQVRGMEEETGRERRGGTRLPKYFCLEPLLAWVATLCRYASM